MAGKQNEKIESFRNIYTQLRGLETAENSEIAKQLHEDVDLALKVFVDMFTPEMKPDESILQHASIDQFSKDGSITVDQNSPETLGELLAYVQNAADEQKHIKAYSTGYSKAWNGIAVPNENGFLIHTGNLKKTDLEIDPEILKENVDPNTLCHVEAGATIDEVQKTLWPEDQRETKYPEKYRVLVNQTGGTILSVAGTAATGAHGNGLRKPIQADIVESFRMITIDNEDNVKQYQIERSVGITNEEEFNKKHPEVTLIQDDTYFHGSVVNIGTMGIVYSYILRCEPGFYLEEKYETMNWEEAKSRLPELYRNESLYSFELIANPYPGLVTICTLSHPPEGTTPSGGRPNPDCPLLFEGLVTAVVWCSKEFPHVIPHIMGVLILYMGKNSNVILNACDARSTLSGIVPPEFNAVRVSECCMKAESPEKIIKVADALFGLYNRLLNKNGVVVNVPPGFRFTAASKAFMAMEYDSGNRPSVLIEQSILSGTPSADNTLQQLRNLMQDEFNGRPHWGMLQDMDKSRLQKLFPKECRIHFTEALKRFDPKGYFANTFTDTVFGRYY